MSLFWSGQTVAAPANKLIVGDYNYYGCMTEATNGRALTSSATSGSTMTNEACESFCSAYAYFGTEYGDECT